MPIHLAECIAAAAAGHGPLIKTAFMPTSAEGLKGWMRTLTVP
jgi:hypothetical protein